MELLNPFTWVCFVAVGLMLAGSIWLTVSAALGKKRARQAWLTNGRPEEYARAQRGAGRSVAELAERLGVDAATLRDGAPSYTPRTIPKRRGGTRKLLVPDPATKALQRTILRRLLARLRAHPAATGFEQGLSIVHNALPHVGQAVVVRLDVIDFFPSTHAERIDAYFRRLGWDAEAAALLTKWTTHDGGLPQGAPTSPRLSNLVNWYLDVQIARGLPEDCRYTRYADDITLSFGIGRPRFVRGHIQRVRRLLRHHGYRMHGRPKTRIQTTHERQCVTGLVVNERVQLPRETRRRLRAIRHHQATGRPSTLTDEQLQGWTALENMIATQRGSRAGG